MDAGRDTFAVNPLHYSQFLSNTMTTFSLPTASAYERKQQLNRGSATMPAAKRLPRNSGSFFPQLKPVPTKRQSGRPKPFQEMSQRELHETFLLPSSQRNLVMHATED